MSVISADLFRLGAIAQTGTVPPPATAKALTARLTGESLAFQPSVSTSNELDPLGQLRGSVLTGAQTSGAIDLELTKHDFFEEMLASVFRSTWDLTPATNDVLKVGTTLRLWYMVKTFFTPGVAPDIFHFIRDCAVSSMSITVAPNAPVTANVDISGGQLVVAEASPAFVYPAPGVNPVFTAPLVQEISIGAVPMTLCFNSLTMTFNSNVRGIECIGTLGFREQALGRFEAAIEGSAYFVDNTLLDSLLAQDEFPVIVVLLDSLANSYRFNFPRCKMTAGSANAAGTGQDVVLNVSIQALFDPVLGSTCVVTRTPPNAVAP